MTRHHGFRSRRRSSRLVFLPQMLQLEDRTVPATLTIQDAPVGVYPHFNLVDPHPNPGGRFGHEVVPLSTGNVVVTDPFDDVGGVDAGAVYLFNATTGALISTLTGSTPGDLVGFNVTA